MKKYRLKDNKIINKETNEVVARYEDGVLEVNSLFSKPKIMYLFQKFQFVNDEKTESIDGKIFSGILKKLSSAGTYGDTFLLKNKSKYLVLKQFKSENPFLEKQDVIREVNALVNLRNIPYIINIEYFGYLKTKHKTLMFLEAGKESLSNYLKHNEINIEDVDLKTEHKTLIFLEAGKESLSNYLKHNKCNEEKCKQIMFQIVLGMYHMSKKGFWHRDLKPENIVLMPDDSVRIIDFGLARIGPHEDMKNTGLVYTLWYRPPELILKNVISNKNIHIYNGDKCDIWSIAIVFLDILGRSPSSNKKTFTQNNELYTLIEMIHMYGIENIEDLCNKDEKKDLESKKISELYGIKNIEDLCNEDEKKDLESKKISELYSEVYGEKIEKSEYRLNHELNHNYNIKNKYLKDLIKGMMNPNPQERFSYENIINHPYFESEKSKITQKLLDPTQFKSLKQTFNFTIKSKHINKRMYRRLSSWLYKIFLYKKFNIITFIQGMALVRLIFSIDKTILRQNYQLIGSIAMQLSCNLYETYIPDCEFWVSSSGKAFTKDQFNEVGYNVFKNILKGNLNVYSSYDELRKTCKDLTTLNGILTAVALCDTLGLHYEYKSEEKVLKKAIEFYNDSKMIKNTIKGMVHLNLPNEKEKYDKEVETYFKVLFEEEKRYFCL